jgi:hypothetical protein
MSSPLAISFVLCVPIGIFDPARDHSPSLAVFLPLALSFKYSSWKFGRLCSQYRSRESRAVGFLFHEAHEANLHQHVCPYHQKRQGQQALSHFGSEELELDLSGIVP